MGRHEQIVAAMLEVHPGMLAKGFKNALVASFAGEESAELRSVLYNLWLRPDCFRMHGRAVDVYEVIVWHDLKPHKIEAYRELVRCLARHDISLAVWVVDRNGRSVQLDL